jgi:hypothetical protein
LGTTDKDIKQKLAAPPAWSDFTIDLDFTPQLAPESRPVLESVMFVCTVDAALAESAQRVLDVRAGGSYDRVAISPADLAGRGDGFGDSYRIYNNATKVTLTAPPKIGDRPFARWEVLTGDSHRKEEKLTVDVVLDSNALVSCQYQPAVTTSWMIQEKFGDKDAASIEAEIADPKEAAAAVALIAKNRDAQISPPKTGEPALIRAGAGADQPIIGVIAGADEATVLEENAGWSKVAYKGLVGYVPS